MNVFTMYPEMLSNCTFFVQAGLFMVVCGLAVPAAYRELKADSMSFTACMARSKAKADTAPPAIATTADTTAINTTAAITATVAASSSEMSNIPQEPVPKPRVFRYFTYRDGDWEETVIPPSYKSRRAVGGASQYTCGDGGVS